MKTIYLIHGTVYGGAEMVCQQMHEFLVENGFDAKIVEPEQWIDMQDKTGCLLVATSTTGAGDVPANIEPLFNYLSLNKPSLQNVMYSVLALGDSSYGATFCMSGKKFDELLGQSGAEQLSPCTLIDGCEVFDPLEISEPWIESISKILQEKLQMKEVC